jgi:hypothetical protein
MSSVSEKYEAIMKILRRDSGSYALSVRVVMPEEVSFIASRSDKVATTGDKFDYI